MKWKPFYRILERRGPVSYVIKNQLDGTTSKVHSEMLRLANIDDWQVPKTQDNRHLRDAAYVVPPQASDSELSSDSDSEMDVPLAKLAKNTDMKEKLLKMISL